MLISSKLATSANRRKFLKRLAPQAGFEPATLRLTEATLASHYVRLRVTSVMKMSDLRAFVLAGWIAIDRRK
jgi:hypothetical protein